MQRLLGALATGDLSGIDVVDGPLAVRRARAEGTTARAVAARMRRTGARATYYADRPRLLVVRRDVVGSPTDLAAALEWGSTAHQQAMGQELEDELAAEADLMASTGKRKRRPSPTDRPEDKKARVWFRRWVGRQLRNHAKEKQAPHPLARLLLEKRRAKGAAGKGKPPRQVLKRNLAAGHVVSAAARQRLEQAGLRGVPQFAVEAGRRNRGTRRIDVRDAGGIPVEVGTLRDFAARQRRLLASGRLTAPQRRHVEQVLRHIETWLAGPSTPGVRRHEVELFVASPESLAELGG